jgi:hypothetical protein
MFPLFQFTERDQFLISSEEDTLWSQHRLQYICTQSGQFTVFFSDVRPALSSEPNCRHRRGLSRTGTVPLLSRSQSPSAQNTKSQPPCEDWLCVKVAI